MAFLGARRAAINVRPDVPAVLPGDAGLNDKALTTNYGQYVDLGLVGIPDGDFTVHLTAQIAVTGYSNDFLGFSLGRQVANSIGAAGSFTIGFSNVSNSPYNNCWGFTATDDAGNRASDRSTQGANWLNNAGVYMMAGPTYFTSGNSDTVIRSIFIQRIGKETSFWIVEPGCVARKHFSRVNNFGSILPKQAYLGAQNTATTPYSQTSNGGVRVSRFFKVAKALTPRQMEAVNAGVDPRLLVDFSAARGDLLWAFSAAGAVGAGATYPDLIQGQIATLVGSVATGGQAVIPPAIVTDQVRVDQITTGKIFHGSGPTCNLDLTGTYTGQDGTIEVKITDYTTTTTIIQDWIQIAVGAGGVWAGTLTGLPRSLRFLDIQTRKKINGVVVGQTTTLRKKFGIGIVYELLGQSLMEYMRTSGSGTGTGAAASYMSFYSRSKSDNGSLQTIYRTGWCNQWEGYGETLLASYIGAANSCPVGGLDDAVSGSPISSWTPAPAINYDDALKSMIENKPKYIVWNQGQGSTGDGYALYQSELTTLYNKLKRDITWPWYFLILPVNNTNLTATGDLGSIRNAQYDWAKAQIGAGETRVVLVGTVNDINLVDGVHGTADQAGFGKFAERIARTINFLEGTAPDTAMGPTISGVSWVAGSLNVDVSVTHNGGTALQTPTASFTASISGNTLTVTNNPTNAANFAWIAAGATLAGSGVTGVTILPYGTSSTTGVGGTGTYALSGAAQTVASQAMTAQGGDITGFQVSLSSAFGSTLTIASARILDASTIRLTLSAVPASAPYVRYQWGLPGSGATYAANGMTNPVYDNRAPYLNASLGFPVTFTSASMQAVTA